MARIDDVKVVDIAIDNLDDGGEWVVIIISPFDCLGRIVSFLFGDLPRMINLPSFPLSTSSYLGSLIFGSVSLIINSLSLGS